MELISREQAVEHMRVLGGEDRERLMGILSNKVILPTIESRPKGEWIKSQNGNYRCSKCGCNPRNDYRASSLEWIEMFGNSMNYCPHCGAEMEGE